MTTTVENKTYAATIGMNGYGEFVVVYFYNYHGDTTHATVSKITSYKSEKTAIRLATKWVNEKAVS